MDDIPAQEVCGFPWDSDARHPGFDPDRQAAGSGSLGPTYHGAIATSGDVPSDEVMNRALSMIGKYDRIFPIYE